MVQERGIDPQGIPWNRLDTSREVKITDYILTDLDLVIAVAQCFFLLLLLYGLILAVQLLWIQYLS
jgi:hypothetical protein